MEDIQLRYVKTISVDVSDYNINNFDTLEIKLYNLFTSVKDLNRLKITNKDSEFKGELFEVEQYSFIIEKDRCLFSPVIPDYLVTQITLNRILELCKRDRKVLGRILEAINKDVLILSKIMDRKEGEFGYKNIPNGRSEECVKFRISS